MVPLYVSAGLRLITSVAGYQLCTVFSTSTITKNPKGRQDTKASLQRGESPGGELMIFSDGGVPL